MRIPASGRPQQLRQQTRRIPRWQRAVLFICLLLGISLIGLSGGILLSQRLAGAHTAAVSGQGARAQTSSTVTSLPQLSTELTACHILPQHIRMLTPKEIDQPDSAGRRLLPNGHAVGCVINQLWVPTPDGGAPNWPGQVILVNLTQQWLWAYQDGKLVFATPVTTGMPWLWTPQGVYHITQKVVNTVFYSLWPPSSPFYYTPEHVDFALFFREKGFYIHDALWREAFGPGTEVPHTDPNGASETGSHGCVNVTYDAGQWLYKWTNLGATVDIVAN